LLVAVVVVWSRRSLAGCPGLRARVWSTAPTTAHMVDGVVGGC
jgi:hypothetical protein